MFFSKEDNKLLVFDFNSTLHRSLHAYQGLSHEGNPTSGIFGFIVSFCNQINIHRPSRVIVCQDFPPYSRKKEFPEYKDDRKKRDDDFLETLKINTVFCKEFLDVIGVTLWEEKGQEADDLIAIVCDAYHTEFKEIVIVSNDDDLNQFFKYPNVSFQRAKKHYTRQDYQRDYPGMNCKKWVNIQALAGSHNGVPGLPGVGIKTAIKALDTPEKLSDKLAKTISDSAKKIELFKKLIHLPYDDSIEPVGITQADFNTRTLINKMSTDWGIAFQNNFERALDIISK